MKKIFCFLLITILALSLLACSSKEETANPSAVFQVGFGRADITPTSPMPLAGYGHDERRLHTNVLDNIYATCIAITDETGETILLFSTDLISSVKHTEIRRQVSQATGVPQDHIILAATHTHSSVAQNTAAAYGWLSLFYMKCVEAATAAMEDRANAEIYIGSGKTENMNFVRHYLMMDGSYAGDNFGSIEAGYKAHASENDPQLQVIKFARGEDTKDIIMVNWQGHPCTTGGLEKTDLSADYVGGTRSYIEYQTKDHFVFFLGASGNQNVKTYLPGEAGPPTDPFAFGVQLGDVILETMENMTKLENTKIRTTEYVFTGQVDHSNDHKLEDAKRVKELYDKTDRATGNKLAHELGITSVYEAGSIVSRASRGETYDMTIYAYSVGDLAFVGAPYEMFADHGVYIKENSPAEMTFIITCANGVVCYIPTNLAYDYVCYESATGIFARGTGDLVAEKYVELLNAHRAN